jgi:uncharacterized protein (DUF1778 family)
METEEKESYIHAKVKREDKGYWVQAAKYARANNIDGITNLVEFVVSACNEKAERMGVKRKNET